MRPFEIFDKITAEWQPVSWHLSRNIAGVWLFFVKKEQDDLQKGKTLVSFERTKSGLIIHQLFYHGKIYF
jgi:hypothetical protein